MNHSEQNEQPPYCALAFFRWFCNPEFREDIEGDLLERFHQRITTKGLHKARLLFTLDVVQLFKPRIIKYVDLKPFSPMSKKNWINLIAIHVLLVIVIFLPFLPGPPNKIVIVLSAIAQAPGFIGLLVVPVALAWTIVELKEWRKKEPNPGILSYPLAIASIVVVVVICFLLAIGLSISFGWITGIIAMLPVVFLAQWTLRQIRKRRDRRDKQISLVPFYLLTIPIVTFVARVYLAEPFIDYSRNLAIQKSEVLIASIEDYKNKEGHYPESIRDLETGYLEKIPNSSIMGILEFRYNKINDQYSLSFSQWLEMGFLEEIVLYDKYDLKNNLHGKFAKYDYSFDLCRVKGGLAIHDPYRPNWQYYRVD